MSAASRTVTDVQSISPTGMSVSAASQRISSRISAWTFSLTLASEYPRARRRPARTDGAQRRTMIPWESMKCDRWLSRMWTSGSSLRGSSASLRASRSTS